MIVERGELIGAGRGFPAEDGVGVASAEERFVSEPVQFADAGFSFGAKRNSRAVDRRAGDGHLGTGQIDFRRVAAAGEQFVVACGGEGWRQFPRDTGAFEKSEQV